MSAAPPLVGDVRADVAIVGGGFLGLWTALQVKRRDPSSVVVVLERTRCGHGPSGRSGGFVNHYGDRLAAMTAAFGADDARAIVDASVRALAQFEDWCLAEAPGACFTHAAQLEVATGPSQEASRDLELSAEEVREICDSPTFRSGTLTTDSATVNPAGLVGALRAKALAAGVQLYEHTRVNGLRDGPGHVALHTDHGSIRARRAVLAIGCQTAAVQHLRRKLSVASSHIVATAPVPEVLADCGWSPAYSICDLQAMLHYTRLTADGRILFGWGGGRMALGARQHPALFEDRRVQATLGRRLLETFPALTASHLDVAWGGPIDVSADHLPHFGTSGRVSFGFGFTGNGVLPSFMGGEILAAMVTDGDSPLLRLALVERRARSFPPAPLAYAGGTLLRRCMLRADRRDELGEHINPLLASAIGVPRRLGFQLPR